MSGQLFGADLGACLLPFIYNIQNTCSGDKNLLIRGHYKPEIILFTFLYKG